jgi:hypothetical protein
VHCNSWPEVIKSAIVPIADSTKVLAGSSLIFGLIHLEKKMDDA